MSYDQKCYDLAEVFLSDYPEKNTPENRNQLAQDIQQAIEDFFSERSIDEFFTKGKGLDA